MSIIAPGELPKTLFCFDGQFQVIRDVIALLKLVDLFLNSVVLLTSL